jgi:hypothetical protein
MLSSEEKIEMLADAHNIRRRELFARVRQAHGSSVHGMDDYISFLMGIQKVFGPFPIDRTPSVSGETKL